MVRPRFFDFLLGWMILFAVIAANAQSSGKTTNPTQNQVAAPATQSAQANAAILYQISEKPNKWMALAAKTNGLAGLNDRPWHVKYTVQSFDEDGKPLQSGTLEEWWESAKKYKYIYAAPGFEQTTYGNGKNEIVTGDPGWPAIKIVADMVGEYLWTPLPPASVTVNPEYKVQHTTMGGVDLTCLQPISMSPLLEEDSVTLMAKDAHFVPTTCFSGDSGAARVVITHYGLAALLNNIVQVEGHYIAKEIALENGNVIAAKLNVVQLDFPNSIPDAEFDRPSVSPPPAAAGEIEVPAPVMAKSLIGKGKFEYPTDAGKQHISGYVVVYLHIDQKGHVAQVQGVMGPRILLDPVMRWAKTFKYRPYKVKGKAVEVKTKFTVFFRDLGESRGQRHE